MIKKIFVLLVIFGVVLGVAKKEEIKKAVTNAEKTIVTGLQGGREDKEQKEDGESEAESLEEVEGLIAKVKYVFHNTKESIQNGINAYNEHQEVKEKQLNDISSNALE